MRSTPSPVAGAGWTLRGSHARSGSYDLELSRRTTFRCSLVTDVILLVLLKRAAYRAQVVATNLNTDCFLRDKLTQEQSTKRFFY